MRSCSVHQLLTRVWIANTSFWEQNKHAIEEGAAFTPSPMQMEQRIVITMTIADRLYVNFDIGRTLVLHLAIWEILPES